jgi:ParB family transcriptional regulator, chromosome partitioning protein
VTLATALIEAPDWLLQAYREGRCRGMNELYELRRLHGEHAAEVEAWASTEPSMTRDRIVALRVELERVATPTVAEANAAMPASRAVGGEPMARADTRTAPSPGLDAARLVRGQPGLQRIHVEFEGQDYQLVVSVAPGEPGHLYVRPLAGGPRPPRASLVSGP